MNKALRLAPHFVTDNIRVEPNSKFDTLLLLEPNLTVTLPLAHHAGAGRVFIVRAVSGPAAIRVAGPPDTLEGLATMVISAPSSAMLCSDGDKRWFSLER